MVVSLLGMFMENCVTRLAAQPESNLFWGVIKYFDDFLPVCLYPAPAQICLPISESWSNAYRSEVSEKCLSLGFLPLKIFVSVSSCSRQLSCRTAPFHHPWMGSRGSCAGAEFAELQRVQGVSMWCMMHRCIHSSSLPLGSSGKKLGFPSRSFTCPSSLR